MAMFEKLVLFALVSVVLGENAPEVGAEFPALDVDLVGLDKFIVGQRIQLSSQDDDGLSKIVKGLEETRGQDVSLIKVNDTVKMLARLNIVDEDRDDRCNPGMLDAIFKTYDQLNSNRLEEDSQVSILAKKLITQSLKTCLHYFNGKFNSLYMAYSNKKTEIDSLSRYWLLDNVFDKKKLAEKSYTVPDERWPDILSRIDRENSIKNLTEKCLVYQRSQLGAFVELTPIMKQFYPELIEEGYNDMPIACSGHPDVYEEAVVRMHFCRSFMKLSPETRSNLADPYASIQFPPGFFWSLVRELIKYTGAE